jgi:hypothetical protein
MGRLIFRVLFAKPSFNAEEAAAGDEAELIGFFGRMQFEQKVTKVTKVAKAGEGILDAGCWGGSLGISRPNGFAW